MSEDYYKLTKAIVTAILLCEGEDDGGAAVERITATLVSAMRVAEEVGVARERADVVSYLREFGREVDDRIVDDIKRGEHINVMRDADPTLLINILGKDGAR
jgi:hypothetical protein